MIRPQALPGLLACGLLALAVQARAGLNFEALQDQPPEQQYRQLSLVLLVSGGADPALVDALLQAEAPVPADAEPVDPDQLRTPLVRIVDQDTMLTGSALLFRFGRDHQQQLRARLGELESANPEPIRALDMDATTEDAILIREAIADSIDYANLGSRKDIAPLLQAYRVRTTRLRNALEYQQFSTDLDRLTAEAIQSVGGKLDAYQRMFEDEVDEGTFDRHIDSAEDLYTHHFDRHAGELAQDIIDEMVLLESQPTH